MTIILTLITLVSLIVAIWEFTQFTQKVNGHASNYVDEITTQLKNQDQHLGMLIGNPKDFPLYQPEFDEAIFKTRRAFKFFLSVLAVNLVYYVALLAL